MKAKVFYEKIELGGLITHKTANGTITASKVLPPKGKRQRRGF